MVLRFNEVRLRVPLVHATAKPLANALLVRALSRGSARIEDAHNQTERVSLGRVARLAAAFLRDLLGRSRLLAEVDHAVAALDREPVARSRLRVGPPVYVRSDLWFGVTSGGSVGHIAGVFNSFDKVGTEHPILLTSDRIPTVRADLETHVVSPTGRFWDFRELPSFEFNARFLNEATHRLDGRSPSFVYQRYGVNNFAGLQLARQSHAPLVLEYNGSEIWIERNWGRRLKYEERSLRIETLLLRSADLVVVVSEPMRAELLSRGVDGSRILVNPNGVDPDVYSPAVDGRAVRDRLDLVGRTVIGFIGTFGPWHGAEVLARSFGRLVRQRSDADQLCLLMIGDGARLAATRAEVASAGQSDRTVFVGRTAQSDGPSYLAASDILVSPHVPNADGSPFFGSPTKLFEYMAMGRPIVASRLDQIGDVLIDGETALFVPPGDEAALADAISRLIDDPGLRARLGAAARARAVAVHTWTAHTRRIVASIERLAGDA